MLFRRKFFCTILLAMRTDETIDKCLYIIGWILLGLIGTAFLLRSMGYLEFLSNLPHCYWHKLTGYYCPGCGGTRALQAFLKGKFLTSLYYHPFEVYTAVVGGWFMLSQTIWRVSGKRIAIGMHYRDIYLWLALALVVFNWLVKNMHILFFGLDLMA